MKKKIIAYDLVSLFHVYSVIASILENNSSSVASLYIRKNSNGFFVLPEVQLRIGEAEINIVHQDEQKFCIFSFFSICYKILIYLVSSILYKRLDKDIVLYHQTYFKPTVLKLLSNSECSRAICVCFEEGIGSYGGYRHWIHSSKRENKSHIFIKYVIRESLKKLCSDKYCVLNFGGLTVTRRQYFKQAVEIVSSNILAVEVGFLQDLQRKNVHSQKQVMVLFTNPMVELGLMSRNEYQDYLSVILDSYKTWRVYIKPHPLEIDLQKYIDKGVYIIDSRISAELVISVMNPDFIVGAYSTSLLIGYNVYDIKYKVFDAGMTESELVDCNIKKLFKYGL